MDIMNGLCVAAERGERDRYMPVSKKSSIIDTDNPIEIVKVLRPKYLYVADLDRILEKGDNTEIILKLKEGVDELIADCGFKKVEELEVEFTPVVGTETFDITQISRKCYVSLDFKGKFLDASKKFKDWESAVEYLNTLDLEGIIVLPLHTVGTLKPDFDLVSHVLNASSHPVLLGGGIGNLDHLKKAKDLGLDGVLIATAIHKRNIPIEIIQKGEY